MELLRVETFDKNNQIYEVIDLWLKSLAPTSRKNYLTDLKLFFNWMTSQKMTQDEVFKIRPIHIVNFKNELLTQNRANLSINRILSSLSSFYSAVVNTPIDGRLLIEFNPVRDIKRMPKTTTKNLVWLNSSHTDRLLGAFNQSSTHQLRNYMLTKTIYLTAQRFESINELKKPNIIKENTGEVFLSIKSKGSKTFRVPLPHFFIPEFLGFISKINTDFIFATKTGTPQSLVAFNKALKVRAKRARIREISVHRLRASRITELLKSGVHPIDLMEKVSFHQDLSSLVPYIEQSDKLLLKSVKDNNPLRVSFDKVYNSSQVSLLE